MLKILAILAICAAAVLVVALAGMFVVYSTHRNEPYSFLEHPTDWLLVLFNGLLVAATVLLFVSGERNVDVARQAAAAAKDSADIAQKALVAANRPWIQVDVQVAGPIAFNVNGAKFTFDLTPAAKMRSPGAAMIRNARAPGPQGGATLLNFTTVPIRDLKSGRLLRN